MPYVVRPWNCLLSLTGKDILEFYVALKIGSSSPLAVYLLGHKIVCFMFCRLGEKDNDQENKDTSSRHLVLPQVYTTATHVSTLIDDEAEDEDEDLIAEHAEEEEALGDDEDLQDLIASTQYEKAGDGARRTALHRKWLEQQVLY